MNKRRKEKLAKEAVQYGKRKHSDKTLAIVWAGADGFEAGYRAAMQDARKAIAEAEEQWEAMHRHTPDTGGNHVAIRRTMLLSAIKSFLLPLR
jgi:hypothetical protein